MHTVRCANDLQWPGYEPWNNGLHVIDNSGQRYTLARVAYTIAKAVQQFLHVSYPACVVIECD